MEHLAHKACFFPASAIVAGTRLGAPTIGQWRLLEAVNSPFAVGGPASAADCALALVLLSRPWRDGRRLLARGGFRLAWAEWRAARRMARGPAPAAEIAAWTGAAFDMAEEYRPDGAPAPSAFAPCCGLAARLAMRALDARAAEFCWRHVASVWDLTVPEALWALTCRAELDGREFETRGEAGEG